MASKLTKAEQDRLHALQVKPQSWNIKWVQHTNVKIQPGELSFMDVIVLRRLYAGQSTAKICSDMRIARSTINMRIAAIIKRFDVETREELLKLPEIIAKLTEET